MRARAGVGGVNPGRGEQASSAARAGTLLRNTVWNILGTGLPLLLTLATFPVLIHVIGIERFGVVAIAWMAAGLCGARLFACPTNLRTPFGAP